MFLAALGGGGSDGGNGTVMEGCIQWREQHSLKNEVRGHLTCEEV